MRVLFTASRGYTDKTTAWQVLDILAEAAAAEGYEQFIVVHGACFPEVDGRQVEASDFLAELWVRRGGHPLPVKAERHPADYTTHGRPAPWVRNTAMVKSGIDICLSFETPDSRGAKGTADMAERDEITVRRFYAEPGDVI